MAVPLLAEVTDEQIHQVCGENPDALCRWVLKSTGNELLAKLARWLVGWPLSTLITVAITFIIAVIGRQVIRRVGRHLEAQGGRRRTSASSPPPGGTR